MNKEGIKWSVILPVSCVGIVGLALLLGVVSFWRYLNNDSEARAAANVTYIMEKEFDAEDSLLFVNSKLATNLQFYSAETSDFRPIAKSFTYHNDKGKVYGGIFYTALHLKGDMSLDEVLVMKNEKYKIEKSRPKLYYNNIVCAIDFLVEPVDSIICSYWGDTKTFKEIRYSDDFFGYYMRTNYMSLRYSSFGPVDIFFKPPIRGIKPTKDPFGFAFLKRGMTVYLLAYVPLSEKKLGPDCRVDPLEVLANVIDWK